MDKKRKFMDYRGSKYRVEIVENEAEILNNRKFKIIVSDEKKEDYKLPPLQQNTK